MYTEVKSNWFKATEIGDTIEGTLISREWREGVDLQGRPNRQEIYELKADAGKFHETIKVKGKRATDLENPVIVKAGDYYKFAKSSVVDAMKKVVIGQKVQFIFDSSIESKDKMKEDFKLVKVYAGPMDPEYRAMTFEEVEQAVTGGTENEEISFE